MHAVWLELHPACRGTHQVLREYSLDPEAHRARLAPRPIQTVRMRTQPDRRRLPRQRRHELTALFALLRDLDVRAPQRHAGPYRTPQIQARVARLVPDVGQMTTQSVLR